MKLLLENWRQYITEDWRDTSWETDDDKVTIGEVVDYLRDKTVDVNVGELIEQLPTLPVGGGDIDEALSRMAAASLDYPIIVVKSDGQYRYVLDGNHRLGKAYVCGGKDSTIKAKILDVSAEAETPERFKRMFGGQNEEVIEEDSGVLSNIFKFCPAGTKCPPESKKTKWWKGR